MPGPHIYDDDRKAGWLLSAVSAEGTAATSFDFRAGNIERFAVWMSASSNGPTAGASAIYTLLHSPIGASGPWWPIAAEATAQKGNTSYTVYSSLYGFITCRLDKVYSAAQTGTGTMFIYVRAGYG